MKQKISTTMITLNEEGSIRKSLESVKSFSSEIVVVDSGSRDKTVEIAKEFGAKVYVREFDNYANQKNFATEMTTGDWIFSIDADEVVSKELAKEIREAVETAEFSGFSIPRKNFIFGKFIKHTRWQPELDRHVWLWKKGEGKWTGDVHEEIVVDGPVGRLENPKLHCQYDTISEFLEMMNKYSELEAKSRLNKGEKFSYIKFITDPIYNFTVRYFYRLGFLDGWRGFILSYLMAIYRTEVWLKIWTYNNKNESHV